MGDEETDYKKLYSDTFTRKVPFPRLGIEEIKVNPINPKYFYIIKKQMFDENTVVKNIVAQEDKENIRERIELLESKIDRDDYDSDEDEFLGDLFEQALDELRHEKIYSVDEEGQAKTSLKLVTRGTKTGGDSFGSKGEDKDAFMAAYRTSQNRPDIIHEQSEEQEGTSLQQSSAVEASGETDESEEVTPSSEVDASALSDEGGESEPDDSEEVDDSNQISDSINASSNEDAKAQDSPAKPEDVKLEEKKESPAKSEGPNALAMAAKVMSAQNVAQKEQEKKIEEEKKQAMGQGQDVVAKPDEAKEQAPEEDDKDKEEPLTEEYVHFFEYGDVANSGKVLKNKPYVLMCCSLEPHGYAVQQKLYADRDGKGSDGNFRFCKNMVFSSCGKYFMTWSGNDVAIYEAISLKLKYKTLLDRYNGDYGYDTQTNPPSMMLSADAKYITGNYYQNSYFTYRADNGERVTEYSGYEYRLYSYINSTDIIGYKSNYEVANTIDIIKYNVRNMNVDVVTNIEYLYNIAFNSKGKACVYEKDNQLFYHDLKGSAGPQKLCEGFDRIDAVNINDDNVSIVYTEESKSYVALYKKNTLQFRKRHEKSTMYYYGSSASINSNKDNKVIYVDSYGSGRIIYTIDEDTTSDICLDFEVRFHNPFLFYEHEKNEIWLQMINNPKDLYRIVFVNTISAIDNTDTVADQYNQFNKPAKQIGLMLTYEATHKIANFSLRTYMDGEKLVVGAEMSRIAKPIKFSELPIAHILSYVRMRGINDKGKEEYVIMFHYLNQLKLYYMKSGKIKKPPERKLYRRNIIQFSDRVFIWEDKGRVIERIESPITKEEKTFFYKAYDAKNVIKMCKKVDYISHKECLLISDEDKYVKIISYDPNNKKFKVEKEYFVSQYFGNESLSQLSTMCFSNGVLYSNNGTYLLQERGMQKNELEVTISEPENFDYNTLHFPLVSSKYCIKQITNYEDKANELYISPPFNSHKVANSQQEYFLHEFFSPDDSSKLIRISSVSYNQKIDLCEMNGNVVSSKLVDGISVGNTLTVSQNGRYMFKLLQRNEMLRKVNDQGEEEIEYQTILKANVIEISLDAGSQTQSQRDSELNDGRDQLHKKEDHGELNNEIITRVCREFELKNEEGYDKITEKAYNLDNYVLNNGDVVTIYFYLKFFYFNEKNHFEELDALLTKHCKELKKNKDTGGYDDIIYTVGQDFLVIKTEKHIYSVRFNPQGPKATSFFYKFKKLHCSPITGYQNISMTDISPTCHPDRILIIYDFKESKNIMVWDIKQDIEVSSFAPREGENFLFYAYGPYKEVEESLNHSLGIKPPKKETQKAKVEAQSGDDPIEPPSEDFDGGEDEEESSEDKYRISHTGYLVFDKYYVNCTTMVPTPFIRVDQSDALYPSEWHKGPRFNADESLILTRGSLYSATSYQDIDFRQKRDQLDASKTETCKYFVDRKSIVLDYVMEDAKLFKIVEQLEKDPLYLLMILTPDKNNKTPLDEAINNNSPRVVELFLNALIKVGDFKLTNAFTSQFLELFDMGVEAFRHFLHICYFSTEQMEMMKKMSADKKEGIYRLPTSSSILDEKFNKVFLEDKKIDAKKNEDDEEEEGKDGLGNSFDDDEEEKDEETLMSDVSIPEGDEDTGSGESGSHKVEKRVEVKAIEFDWMLTTKEGEDFLEGLRQTDNLAYFEIDVVKDLILFQWSYFLPRIIMFLFIPFLVFFIMFILYTTWILDEMFNEEDDNGDWHTAALVIGICVLVFQVFFIYVEIRQMFFHRMEYLKSFWNMLDIASVILNVTVVILHLTDVKEDDLNAVSSIAVLVLWFRLFYLLRVFSETAYLISMIQAIILEMKYFVLALLIAILAFANTFYILGRNDEENFAGDNVWDAFIFSYKMGLGDFDTDGFGTVDEGLIWTLWFLNTFIILIILLNLVIAIMGDTFDRVQETQESTMLQEFASIMRENEFIVSRKRIFKGIKYMVVVQPEKAEGGVTTSWEGKLNQLKRFLEDSSEKHIVHLRKMEKKMEKMIEFGLEEKLKPLEDKVNQKITSLEFRLQKTNKIFDQYPVKELLDKVLKMKG